jgi:hypothetical protein
VLVVPSLSAVREVSEGQMTAVSTRSVVPTDVV